MFLSCCKISIITTIVIHVPNTSPGLSPDLKMVRSEVEGPAAGAATAVGW